MNAFVKRFTRNEVGRDFAVGDIHGAFSTLEAMLEQIGFDETVDRLFSVGDLVDRGPESERSLEFIAKPWFHAVRGNHEDMALRWPTGNMDACNYTANGGGWNVGNPPEVAREFSDAFSMLPVAIEVETDGGLVGIVHAECPFESWTDFRITLKDERVPNGVRKQVFEEALWSRERITNQDQSNINHVRAVIVGHTPLQRPAVLGNVYYIDTGAVFREGYFTFINLATLETIPAMPKKLEWKVA